MRRATMLLVTILVASLGSVLPSVGPAGAARQRVSLDPPTLVRADLVRLTGQATTRHVELQRRRHGKWRKVARLRVRHGTYRTAVEPGRRSRKYRTVSGDLRSRPRVVERRRDACGRRPLKGDGTRWTCTFHDDFDGTRLDRHKWVPQEQYFDSVRTCYVDDPSVISVGGGTLSLSVRATTGSSPCATHAWNAPPYTAGNVSTWHRFSQRYGRMQARLRVTATDQPGLQEAFWLWPDDRETATVTWPAAGEIDVMETYSLHPDLGIPFLHYTADDNGGPIDGTNTAWGCPAARGEYNTWTLEWSRTRLEIWVNGHSCLVNTSGDAAFRKKYIVAFTQAVGSGSNAHDGRAPLPATTDVDYVRVWR